MAERLRVMKAPLDQPADLYRNFATDKEMADRAKKLVLPMLERARRNRQKSDEKALRRYRQWAMQKNDSFYQGRANVKIPAVRKGVERMVTQAIRETFPNDDWYGLRALAREFEPNVAGMKTLMDVQLRRRMQVKRKARPVYRQLFLYGLSPVRLQWREETKTVPMVGRGPDGSLRLARKTVTVYDDPDFVPVDYFSWGVYPETVMDIDDARLVYEDMVVDLDDLKADKANYANLDEAKQGAGGGTTGSQALQKRQERLAKLGITETELFDKAFAFLTQCCVRFDFKDGLGPVPAIVTLAWESVVVRLQRNAYGRPFYRAMKDLEVVGEFLPHARTEATEGLQIVLDDSANQDQDASTFANNPVAIIDPVAAEDYYSIAIYPGAKIPAPPDAVKFDRPPEAAYSQKEKIAFYATQIDQMLGSPSSSSASPAASGQPRGARTFGGMQMMQALANMDIKEVVEFQEDLFWEPLLADIAWMNANFMTDERLLQTAGKDGAAVKVNRETFAGDYAYEWQGTVTMTNQTLRSAAMLVFMNVAGRVPMPPGTTINGPHILREWWRSQGLKDADRVVIESGRQQPIDPEIENELVRLGRAIEVSLLDDDAKHLVSHLIASQEYEPDDPRLEAMLRHRLEHEQSQQAKITAQIQAAMRAVAPGPMNGAAPPGARSGTKATATPPTGVGPERTLMDSPAGAMA